MFWWYITRHSPEILNGFQKLPTLNSDFEISAEYSTERPVNATFEYSSWMFWRLVCRMYRWHSRFDVHRATTTKRICRMVPWNSQVWIQVSIILGYILQICFVIIVRWISNLECRPELLLLLNFLNSPPYSDIPAKQLRFASHFQTFSKPIKGLEKVCNDFTTLLFRWEVSVTSCDIKMHICMKFR